MAVVKSILLSGSDWQIRQDETGEPLEWARGEIPASVPGNIQGDLEDARILKPLRYGMGDDRLLSVCLHPWRYSKEFMLSAEDAEGRLTLVLDGVDYSSEVFINGRSAGRTEGQFNRTFLDIGGLAHEGKNRIEVRIDPMPESLTEWLVLSDGKQSGEGTPYHFVTANDRIRQTLKGLKTPATCSYDWATNVYALGIWKDVRIDVTGDVRIDWLQILPEMTPEGCTGTVAVIAETDSLADTQAIFRVRIRRDGPDAAETEAETEVPVILRKGRGTVRAVLRVEHPELWWPNGYGSQPLYRAECGILTEGIEAARTADRFAFRSIAWEPTEGAPEGFENHFGLRINGVRVRTMGSCITSPDLLPGRIGEHGVHYIEMAKECGMTALRQHGGQVIFPESMYYACDRLGILLLVDFPLGNCIPESDPVFLANLGATIGNIVRQLRNHPSIVEWTGGNELNVFFNKNADRTGIDAIRAAAESADSARVFRDTCPISGSRHAPWDYIPDIHYDFYNSDLKDNFGVVPMMRYGEFGCQTPANPEVWYSDIPETSRTRLDPEDPVLIRKNVFYAVFSPEYWLLRRVTEEVFGPLDDFESLIAGGQYLAGEGMRYAIDALRAMGRRLGGFSSWDYNEPWPNGAGSFMVDYDGMPVMMYHYAKQALEPVSLQLRYDSLCFDFFCDSYADLRIVSDANSVQEGLAWEWVCRDRLGRAYGSGSGTVTIAPLGMKELARIRVTPPENMRYGPALAELTLRDAGGAILSERLYIFGAKGVRAPLRALLKPDETTAYEWGVPYAVTGMAGGRIAAAGLTAGEPCISAGDGWETLTIPLTNTGGMTAILAEARPLLEYRADLFVRTQWMHVPPGQTRDMIIRAKQGGSLSLAQTGWEISCRNAAPVRIEPDSSVLLHMGRRDRTNRGYAPVARAARQAADGRRIMPGGVPYRLTRPLAVSFELDRGTAASAEFFFSDVSAEGFEAAVFVNGKRFAFSAEAGLGLQDRDRGQLAYPSHAAVAIPDGALRSGRNEIRIVPDRGWACWDAFRLMRR